MQAANGAMPIPFRTISDPGRWGGKLQLARGQPAAFALELRRAKGGCPSGGNDRVVS
jgi:hypothetical protein